MQVSGTSRDVKLTPTEITNRIKAALRKQFRSRGSLAFFSTATMKPSVPPTSKTTSAGERSGKRANKRHFKGKPNAPSAQRLSISSPLKFLPSKVFCQSHCFGN
jgi:hypothetical protein